MLQATTELAVDVAGPMATPIWAAELAGCNEPDELMEAGSASTGSYCSCAPRRSMRHQ